jgi:hypothetical protein
MLTKEQFVNAMSKIKELRGIERKINDSLKLLSEDFGGFYLGKAMELTVDILKMAMDDEGKDSWIDYFLYELDFGKNKMSKNCVTEKDGKKYSLRNPGELWDYLDKEKLIKIRGTNIEYQHIDPLANADKSKCINRHFGTVDSCDPESIEFIKKILKKK